MSGARADYLMLEHYGYRDEEAYWGPLPSTFLISLPTSAGEGISRALDIPCGQGRNTAVLAARGYAVDAVDSSALAIRTVTALAYRGVEARVGDMVEYAASLAPARYDIVLSNHGLQYLSRLADVETFLDSCLRSLKDGGHLALAYFTEPREMHPPDVQAGALLIPREHLLRRYLERRGVSLVYFQFEEMPDSHGGVEHRHAVERLIVRKVHSAETLDE